MALPVSVWRRPTGWSTPWRPVPIVVRVWPGDGLQRTREVIEVPVVPIEATEHVFVVRTCPVCEVRRMPKGALEGMALRRQHLGINLASLIVTLREEGRMPFRTIQWYLRTVHQLHLSVGGIVQVIHRAAQQAKLAVVHLLERIRASPVVQADRNRLAPGRGQRVCVDLQHCHRAVLPATRPG